MCRLSTEIELVRLYIARQIFSFILKCAVGDSDIFGRGVFPIRSERSSNLSVGAVSNCVRVRVVRRVVEINFI
jgi:hypothetical protein